MNEKLTQRLRKTDEQRSKEMANDCCNVELKCSCQISLSGVVSMCKLCINWRCVYDRL